MAAKLTIRRGRTFAPTFTYSDASGPVDLTGKVLEFHLRKNESKTDYLNLVIDDPATATGTRFWYTDASEGEFSLKISDEDTADYGFSEGHWDVSLEESGDSTTIASGTFVVINP